MSASTFAWPGFPDDPPIGEERARELASRIRSLADPHRVRIASLIAAKDPVPMTASEVIRELGLSQSTVSHHLKQLVAAGLLSVERTGTWSMYRVEPESFQDLAASIAPGPGM